LPAAIEAVIAESHLLGIREIKINKLGETKPHGGLCKECSLFIFLGEWCGNTEVSDIEASGKSLGLSKNQK
jgi:hypothetical protein